jgi:nucleotide-binding universal stress UspA family protein
VGRPIKILIAYDGTVNAKTALKYGLKKAGDGQGEIIVLQVFDSSLFVDYDAGPKAEAMARAEAAQHLSDARAIAGETGPLVPARFITEEGDAGQKVLQYAETEHAGLVLVPPRFKSLRSSAPCPVIIVPGTILVPVDNTAPPGEHGQDRRRGRGDEIESRPSRGRSGTPVQPG